MAGNVKRAGFSPWGFPIGVGKKGLRGDPRIKEPGPASLDPRTALLPENGVLEQIDPDQRRRRIEWVLEEEAPDPGTYRELMRGFLRGGAELRLGEPSPALSDDEQQRLSRMLADEASMLELLARTQRLRLEVRLRVASERPS